MSKEVIARFVNSGKTFEIIVDSTKIESYKQGKLSDDDFREMIITDGIFSNIRNLKQVDEGLPMKNLEGTIEKHDDSTLTSVFGTTDFLSIAKKILDAGEIQLTTDQRKEMTERKKRQIISFIAFRAVDPRTGKPHPPQRVEFALEQLKIKIDPFIPSEQQLKDLLPKLKAILPLSIEEKTIELSIPVEYAGKVRYLIEKKGKIIKETWAGANWIGFVTLPAGMVPTLLDELLGATHGNIKSNVE
ncbi:MAG: ribosome assembly factor SBDS [Candidatus Aenigmarchaeota archaeon]|nr:ribosome assembly factor SBDS [Candidatus Aenigmarchaeota archaeon]